MKAKWNNTEGISVLHITNIVDKYIGPNSSVGRAKD